MSLASGDRLGPYEIVGQLGRGGMGEVYRGRDTRLQRPVAIKILTQGLSDNERFRRRFQREARAISQLQHKNVCTLYDVGSDQGVDYLVMEYLDGETLEERLRHGPIDGAEAMRICQDIAEGIAAAHAAGIVHRDLKPANVMLSSAGTKVLDFGLARAFVSTDGGDSSGEGPVDTAAETYLGVTEDGSLIGTVPYMAPEQLEGRPPDARSDIWALGCIIFEMTTGERPFKGESKASLIGAILRDQPQVPEQVHRSAPRLFSEVIERCLQKDPSERLADAAAVAVALEDAKTHGDSQVTLDPPERPRWLTPAATVAAIAIVLLVVWLWQASSARRPPADDDQDRLALRAPAPLLAVIPFDQIGEDSVGESAVEMADLATGITEELNRLLLRVPNLRITVPTLTSGDSAFEDELAAAWRTGADFAVVGTLRRSDDRLRLLARLLQRSSGELLWSDAFEGEVSDVFRAQEQIATRVSEALGVALDYTGRSQSGLDPVAVERYLAARKLTRDSGSLEAVRESQRILESALVLQPDFDAALGELCRVHMMIFARTEDPDEFARGEQRCRSALERDADSPHARLALATLNNNAGQYERARELARSLIAELPNFEEAYNQLGQAATRLGDLEEAERAYRQATTIDESNWRSYLSLGNFLAMHQRYEDAIEPFTRITELRPDDFIGWASLGVTHYEAGNFEQARELVLQSLELNENSRSYFNLGLIYTSTDEPALAAEAFQKSVELNPSNYRAHIFRAQAFETQGDAEQADRAKRQALDIIEGLIDVNPNDAYVIANGALILSELGDSDRAIEWAESARSLNSSNPKVQFDIGLTYFNSGYQARGAEELAAALEMGYPRELFTASQLDVEVMQHPRIRKLLDES